MFSRITAPLCLFYSAHDPWIPVDASIAIWRDALLHAGNTDVEIHRIAHAGHAMVIDEPAYLNNATLHKQRFSPEYTHRMQAFVRRMVARSPGNTRTAQVTRAGVQRVSRFSKPQQHMRAMLCARRCMLWSPVWTLAPKTQA